MMELKLTKTNRIKLARAFRSNKRVDISIDCVIEGQMGKAFADDSENPTAFQIEVGPFRYFAGDARSPGGREMIKNLPPYTLLMPLPTEWMEVAKEIHGEKLNPFSRYSFSSDNLSVEHLDHLLANSPFKDLVQQIDVPVADQSLKESESIVDISEFDSAEDFTERGIGFCLMNNESMIGAAYSSLVCSRGIEVSMFVFPEHRRKGIATALASKLLRWCLEHNLDANWDAANPESCKLAEKLGYVYAGTYDAYFLKE
jgi:GNAT superfamily N-acetyltransferase